MTLGSRREKGPRRGRRGQAGLWPYVIAVRAAAVVLAVMIVVLSLGCDGDGGGGGGGGDGPVILPSPRPADIAQEGHLLGSAGAPVTLIEYGDFQ